MAQKLIRDIPDASIRVVASKAALAEKSVEAYIRDLIIEAGTIHSDESTVDSILYTKRRVADLLSELSRWFAQSVEDMDSEQVREQVKHPVQALACLLYMKSDLMHAMEIMSKLIDTME